MHTHTLYNRLTERAIVQKRQRLENVAKVLARRALFVVIVWHAEAIAHRRQRGHVLIGERVVA